MLWGGGAPFTRAETGTDLVDVRGSKVRMLGAVADVLAELKTSERWKESVVAVASCTDEPEWAQECLRKFDIGGGLCMKDTMHIEEIHKGNKQGHLQNIAAQTGIALEEMLFFDVRKSPAARLRRALRRSAFGLVLKSRVHDRLSPRAAQNERGNCVDVAQLGVTVAWVPEGVTAGAWASSLERFPEPGVIFDFRKGG